MAFSDLDLPSDGETSADIAHRVQIARDIQTARFDGHEQMRTNSDAEGEILEQIAEPDSQGRDLLTRVADKFGLTARGYHRVLRVARTIADLDGSDDVRHPHIAEAVGYRLTLNTR